MKRVAFAVAAAVAACSPQPAPSAPANDTSNDTSQTALQQVPLAVVSDSGTHAFTVEVARTLEEQEMGLMFRKALAPDHGMIFPYNPPRPVAFWMHNTLIPLDIIYVRADGTISSINNAKPLDDKPIPSGEPIALVLEIAGGRAAELGIEAGDKVEW
ncbi:MAG TPA: DUF192 domain-containing protein [Sphingomicrobium sp.]|nr:DUF192 domain-containing protein [Sphingomicrobium sp.]